MTLMKRQRKKKEEKEKPSLVFHVFFKERDVGSLEAELEDAASSVGFKRRPHPGRLVC